MSPKIFTKISPILFLWIVSLTTVIITFLLIYFKIHPNQTPAALHYNVITGVDVYGVGWQFYKIPFIGLLILGVNSVIVYMLKREHDFLSLLAVGTGCIVTLILFIAVLFLLRVN